MKYIFGMIQHIQWLIIYSYDLGHHKPLYEEKEGGPISAGEGV